MCRFLYRDTVVSLSFTCIMIPYSVFCAVQLPSAPAQRLLMFGVFPLCVVTINQMIYNLGLARIVTFAFVIRPLEWV